MEQSQIAVVESTRKRETAPSQVPATATPMDMLRMVVAQGADIDKMKQLMELSERWEANQARKAFDAAISCAKAEIKPIVKNREVDFTSQKGRTNYKHEDFAQIATQVDPILAKHGLSYRHRSTQEGKKLSITCILSHRDGHSEETTLTADNDESGNKNSIQGIGSTATYLQRYTLKLALGLAASKDNDGQTGDPSPTLSEEQIANIEALLTEVGANKAAFLRWCRIDSIGDILAKNYSAVVKEIERKRARS